MTMKEATSEERLADLVQKVNRKMTTLMKSMTKVTHLKP